ncbi:MAG: polysaccharide biosynthesis/export family protein [bacterium]
MNNPRNVLVLALLAALAGGCAAKNNGSGWSSIGDGSPAEPAALHSRSGGHSLADSPAVDLARLRRIYDERTEAASGYDYPIGTGDMIEISVPGMPELDDETVRVASSGTVSLPMIGDINAAGLTEKQFKSELRKALAQYMHRPHVAVHVTEYRSRQVGVLGAVTEPGLHTVKSAQATILDMISEAGGLTDEATQRLLFIPVDRLDPQEAESLELVGLVSNNAQRSQLGADPQEPLLQASDPIVIDLDKMNSRSQRFALAVPVRPGDTIMALGGGQVFVQGWVEQPGAQKMTRGLTLLGAIAAAGGPSFPAKKSHVQILRDGGGKERIVRTFDIGEIEEGKAEDIALHEGDLVLVEAEGVKLVGYGVYRFFSEVMRVGVSVASPF